MDLGRLDFTNRVSIGTCVGVFAVCLLWAISRLLITTSHRLPLPPGPPRLPLIGNLHQAPAVYPWRKYHEWTQQYGPVFYLRYGIQDIIMLGTADAAADLLDKRGAIYSSRPRFIMGGECLSRGLRFLFMPYGPEYRKHQRMISGHLTLQLSQAYRPLQDLESRQLMYEMLSTDDFPARFHRYASSVMFSLLFGKRLARGDEPEVKAVGEVIARVLYAARVGTWAVDALPFLNYLPLLLAPWKRLANKWHAIETEFYLGTLAGAEKTRTWNYSKQTLAMKEARDMTKLQIAFDMGTMYEAGTDTTTMALEIFVLAAVVYPEFVRQAQKELDDVVGPNRLPSFDHRPHLPYLEAAVKEVLRWRPVSVGGIPHAVTQDDQYMGYHIPRGATVIANHWAISHDPEIYPSPHDFRPERWLETPDLPLVVAFGFGRRVCTGQHMAKNSLFINMARLLWGFDIGYATTTAEGKRDEVDPMAFTQGFNSRPMPFRASFRVRGGQARKELIEREWLDGERDVDVILDGIGKASGGQKITGVE